MKKFILFIGILLAFSVPKTSFAHCEMPCGIYDDEMRIHMIKEDLLTLEKSINAINALSKAKKDPLVYNQLVRWIHNKDEHARKIQEIVWQYFLTQRVKPVNKKDKAKYQAYLRKLELLHQISFYAMKVKQSVDMENINKIRDLLEEFEEAYFGKEHMEEHHHH
jgi:nickel superoxide dismutase